VAHLPYKLLTHAPYLRWRGALKAWCGYNTLIPRIATAPYSYTYTHSLLTLRASAGGVTKPLALARIGNAPWAIAALAFGAMRVLTCWRMGICAGASLGIAGHQKTGLYSEQRCRGELRGAPAKRCTLCTRTSRQGRAVTEAASSAAENCSATVKMSGAWETRRCTVARTFTIALEETSYGRQARSDRRVVARRTRMTPNAFTDNTIRASMQTAFMVRT